MRTFLIVLTFLVLGLAGIVAAHPIASNAVYTLNWIFLCLSLTAAIVIRGERRRFWIGFAVFAWAYWLMNSENMDTPRRASPWNWMIADLGRNDEGSELESSRLLTSLLVDFFEAHVSPGRRIGDRVQAQYGNGSYYPGEIIEIGAAGYLISWRDGSSSPDQWTPAAKIQPGTAAVRVAAHSFVCTLWGLIGGVVACLVLRNHDDKSQSAPPAARVAKIEGFQDPKEASAPVNIDNDQPQQKKLE